MLPRTGMRARCWRRSGGFKREAGLRPSGMTVIHPDRYINEIARRMPELTGRDEIEEALDRLEYVFEVIPPEMQDNVETLIRMLREKLKDAK